MSAHQPLPPRAAKNRIDKPARPRKRRLAGKIAAMFVMLVILALGTYVAYLWDKVQNNLDKVADPVVKEVPKEELAEAKPVGLLLLGLDTRAKIGGMNTDVMMAAVFNPKSKTATVVSIPRDSDLALEGYKKQKANAFYNGFLQMARNRENLEGDEARKYAFGQMKEMMTEFFGVPFDYTVLLDFQAFIDVVDALGGVRVYVDQDMRYWDNADGTDIDLKKGDQVLDGEEALGFVRYRKSKNGETPSSSDFERNERQDRLLGAIIDKLKSLGTAARVGNLLDAVGDNVLSDIPKSQIENMIATYFGISRQNVRFIALTGEWKSPYVHLDPDKLEEAKRALREELQPDGRTVASGADQQADAGEGQE